MHMASRSKAVDPEVNRLPTTLDHRLLLYSVAAGMALAATPPSYAEVVFTPSNVQLYWLRGRFVIDLDHDGVADFTLTIKNVRSFSGYSFVRGLKVYGNQPSNQIGMAPLIRHDQAEALPAETIINGGHRFLNSAGMETKFGWGYWDNVTDKFLAARFLINGEIHYGWIGFRNVSYNHPYFNADLAGWAYEADPNTPIVAGNTGTADTSSISPSSLEILAAGHSAIERRRKRNTP